VVFTGIAHPGSVYRLLRGLGVGWEETVVYADHHAFTDGEIRALRVRARGARLITTEKDAVRLPADLPFAVLRVSTEPSEGAEQIRAWLADRWPAAQGLA
jgi:tetraacyldisaccharide 4'-kinase